MKLSRTAIKELSKRYRAVLLKCALMNLAVFTIGLSPAYADAENLNVSSGDVTISEAKSYSNVSVSGGTVTFEKTVGIIDDFNISGGKATAKAHTDIGKDFRISGGEAIFEANSIISNDLLVSGGNVTFEDANITNNIKIDNGTATFKGYFTSKNIEIAGGTTTFEEGAEVAKTLKISAGTVTIEENLLIGDGNKSVNAVEILGGSVKFMSDDKLDGDIEANSDVVISGGDVYNPNISSGGDIIINGGNIKISEDATNDSDLSADGNVIINSDTTTFQLANDNPDYMDDNYFIQGNKSIQILGKGLSFIRSEMMSPEITGKITMGKKSRIGNFGWILDKWKYGDKYVLVTGLDDVKTGTKDFTLSASEVTLNDDSMTGAGYYYANITSASPLTGTFEQAQKLTQAEMDNSNDVIWEKITSVSKYEDLDEAIMDALEVDYSGTEKDRSGRVFDELEDYVEYKIETDALTDAVKEQIKTDLNKAYSDYNKALDDYSANVIIKDSKVTLNGTSALVNYSFKDDDNGNITFTNSELTANGQNKIYASEGDISFQNNSTLTVGSGAVLDVVSKNTNAATFDSTSAVNLSGKLNGSIIGGTLNVKSRGAEITGTVKGSTINVGENSFKTTKISDSTISAILTDAAKTSAIITAEAENVTLNLDMGKASRDVVNQYKITDGTGYTFGDYATNRYAVSTSAFDVKDAKTIGKLADWTGGDLYILRLATESQAAIEDMEKSGVSVSDTEKNAAKALDFDDDVMAQQSASTQANVKAVNDALAQAEGNPTKQKQILSEVAPDQSVSGAKTASNTANAVHNVVGTRLSGGMKSGRMSAGHGGNGHHGGHHGRQGGDYVSGQVTVWAQGMMNYAKLDKTDGYNSHSSGFAMGFEGNVNDEVKVGAGYAFTRTDISSQRSNTDVDTHTGFIYGEYKPNEFYVNAVVSYGHSKYDEKTSSLGLTSDYEADTISAQVAAGYELGLVTPEIGLRYTNVKLKEYEDAVGQKMHDDRQETWTGVASVKVEKEFMLGDKTALTPEVKVGATYDFVRDDECRGVSLADHSSYVTEGDPMKRFGIEAGVGVTLSISDDVEVSVNYEGKYKTHYEDHTGMINFKYNF